MDNVDFESWEPFFNEDEIPTRLITKTQAAAKMGIARITLYRLIKKEGFPVVELGDGLERIDIKDVVKWISDRKRYLTGEED